MTCPVYIAGSGTFLPGAPIPFDRIESVLGELTEAPPRIQKWIRNTGPLMKDLLDIEYVHYAIDPETREFTHDNVSMSVEAARAALEAANIDAGEVDLICYGSAHQDQMPTASVRIQEQLGIERCEEYAIHANCTSAYKALHLAHELLRHGTNRTALVLSSNVSSSELRASYYNQALVDKESLFLRWFLCDGAGALLLSRDPALDRGFRVEATYVESVGGRRPSLMFNKRPAFWMNPREEYEGGCHHLRQAFRNALAAEVFRDGDRSVFTSGLHRMLESRGIPVERVRYFQLNMPTKHIVEAIVDECEKLGLSRRTLYTRLDTLGYCGPPMALVCLDKILREERFQPGDRVLSFVTEVSKFMQGGYSIEYAGHGR